MNAVLAAITSILAALLERLVVRSRTGVDADGDVGRLRRAGGRLRDWLRQSGARK